MGGLPSMSAQAGSSRMTEILARSTGGSSEECQPHIIAREFCERYGLCMELCKFDAIIVR